jgi:DNA-binding transcriptional regulator YiaG
MEEQVNVALSEDKKIRQQAEKETVMSVISEEIRVYRARHKIGQQQLADELGTTKSSVCYWETGTRMVPTHMFIKINNLLDCDLIKKLAFLIG